jgi:hypothetical protein
MSHKYELGTVPPAGARDAVHVAIFAAMTKQYLTGGDSVSPDPKNPGYVVFNLRDVPAIGIIDPFIGAVYPETLFWVILNPGTVTDLRHTWSHPALPPLDRVDTPAHAMVSANVLASRDDKITELEKAIEAKEARIEELESELGYDDGCRGC